MNHLGLRAAALAAGLILSPGFAQTAPVLPPVEAFGQLPDVSEPQLSPDGKHFALVRALAGQPIAVILDLSGAPGVKPGMVRVEGGFLADLQWAKNDRLILFTKQSHTANFDRLRTWAHTVAVDVDGTNLKLLMHNMPSFGNNVGTAHILDVAVDDPNYVYMGLYDFNVHLQEDYDTRLNRDDSSFKFDIVKVDIHTGKGEVFKSGDVETMDWLMDGHGGIVAKINEIQHPLREQVFSVVDGHWSKVGEFDAHGDKGAGLAGLTEDGKALVFLRYAKDSRQILMRYELANGAESELFDVPGYDVGDPILDAWTGRVIGAHYIDDRPHDHYFDEARQGLQNGIEKAFPGKTVSIVSWNQAHDAVVVAVEGPRDPAQYYVLNRKTHEMKFAAATYPSLKDSDLGEQTPYVYKARDGLQIPGYLTLPPGKSGKNLPMVVFPHGGPDARDYIGFDWMAQFLANRGYAVLQPNFRGSSGYGHAFTEAGLHQWGLKVQDDVTDGVKKLIADGVADPKRICIVGASFGGYVALAGATFTPDLYACAASWAGVSDLPMALHASVADSGAQSHEVSFWLSRMGDDLHALIATSPSRNVEKVKTPILLMHGEGDTTVLIEQSVVMNEALTKAHKPVQFIRIPGEDHYMNLADTRVQILKALEKFLKENIGS